MQLKVKLQVLGYDEIDMVKSRVEKTVMLDYPPSEFDTVGLVYIGLDITHTLLHVLVWITFSSVSCVVLEPHNCKDFAYLTFTKLCSIKAYKRGATWSIPKIPDMPSVWGHSLISVFLHAHKVAVWFCLQWWDIPADVMQKLNNLAYDALVVLRRVVLSLLPSMTMSMFHSTINYCLDMPVLVWHCGFLRQLFIRGL
jgi:hypothetical protein